jgi:hypothetical protein
MTDAHPPPCRGLSRRAALSVVAAGAATAGTALVLPRTAARAQTERVIDVGPDEFYRTPSEAANVVQDGYTVRIAPGEYVDCASWRANNLTIVAPAGDVHVRDRTCERKGIWVVSGNDIVVDGITFSGARVPDMNGAGIRAQGRNLTVRNSTFIDNQVAILTNPNPESTILIENSTFERNGESHGVYAGRSARLRVANSVFRGHRIRHNIKSRALVTEVVDNVIEDGPRGSSSYLIEAPNGGTVTITGNTLHKGPNTDNAGTAIFIGAEGNLQPSEGIYVSENEFRNDGPTITVFVRNATNTPAVLQRNRLIGSVIPLEGPGELIP